MTTLDQLQVESRALGWRTVAIAVSGLIVAFLVWAHFAAFDQFAVAEGEVAPMDKVKVIQHLEGGVIAQIFVTDGQVVKQNDPLVEVDLAISGTNKDELAAKLDGLNLSRARLLAEANNQQPSFPDDIAKRRPDQAGAELAAYHARQVELENRLQSAQDRVNQADLAVKELLSTSAATATDLQLSRKNLAMSADLLKDGLTSKMDHLEHEREEKLLEGKYNTLQSSVPKAQAALAEARRDLDDTKLKFHSESLQDLGNVEQDIARTQELLTEAQGRASRRTIRSPVNGIVKNMRYHTIGGVIGAGDPIMEVVPADETLVIEAHLSPQDAGQVKVGQPTRIKVSAFDYTKFGVLPGTLTYVGADSVNDAKGVPYFQVVIKPDRNYFGDPVEQLIIRPGMTATVDIRTGSRTVMEYLLKPVIRMRYDALHER
jgi:adhesin transport system membrane fusion protein